MEAARLDQHRLGPRFYRLEFERSVAMRRLALQRYPLELAQTDIVPAHMLGIVDIVRAVENVVKAAGEYADELAFEARKVSTYLKSVDSMGMLVRVRQVLALVEDIESRMQAVIRYGWVVEREWSEYVVAAGPEGSRKGLRAGVFSSGHLRSLDTWHAVLTNAIARMRARLEDGGTQQRSAAEGGGQQWDSTGVVYAPNPMHWSTEYVLEKAKGERAKKRRADSWLDAVPQITHTRPGHKPCIQATDIRRRNALHYAAQSSGDLLWLKRLNYLDLQDLRQQTVAVRAASLGAADLSGDTPLSIAARTGNAAGVRYIVDESGVEASSGALVDAALAAYDAGQAECLPAIVARVVAHADGVALATSMAAFYGFDGLFDLICTAHASTELAVAPPCAGDDVCSELGRIMQRTGGCTMFHLAVLNGRTETASRAHRQTAFRWMPDAPAKDSASALGRRAFDPHARDDAHVTALDVANFFGHRACADVLLTTYPTLHPVLMAVQAPSDAPLCATGAEATRRAVSASSDSFTVFVGVGANDTRQRASAPGLVLHGEAVQTMLDNIGLPRSTRLLLRIDSEEGMEVSNTHGWVADATVLTQGPLAWRVPAHFQTVHPESFVLKLDLLALADHALLPSASEYKAVAHAVLALPPVNERIPARAGPVCAPGASYLRAIFTSVASSDVVAEANLEVVVAAPYARRQAAGSASTSPASSVGSDKFGGSSASSDTLVGANSPNGSPSGKHTCTTQIYGHRGSGMNCAPFVLPRRLQLGENTVLSMQKAVRDGAAAVEFDVQLTRDLVPVVYHDWIVAETNMDIPVSALTLTQFMACNPRNRPLLSRPRSRDSLRSPDAAAAIVAGHACRPIHVANSESTVQAPFATLRDLFELLPSSVGFDIEVKYPMPDEADEFGVCSTFEINLFVDRILDVVYEHLPPPTSSGPRRHIVFTSFHPDICLLLAHKVNGDIPVMLLTDAGMSAMADCRCNSIETAVRLCKWAGLAGLVSHVAPISQSPRVALLVRRHGLALATYGELNNHAEHVRQQQAYGVDIVIADDVRAARSALG
ncbi:Glycerophosphocholine phosphodiesterase [Coemansia sp. RSA 2320]|nr:Glycerophosphocholine phosphodiesterase [Coemansia sp. RSA 2320]